MNEKTFEHPTSITPATSITPDIGAETKSPEKPKPPTETQIKAWRRAYITKRNGTVKACGHKFHYDKHPTNNCVHCWRAYFYSVTNLEQLHKELCELGVKKFIATRGEKFYKMFRGFIIYEMHKEQNAIQEREGRGQGKNGSTGSPSIEGSAIQAARDSGKNTGQETLYQQLPTTIG